MDSENESRECIICKDDGEGPAVKLNTKGVSNLNNQARLCVEQDIIAHVGDYVHEKCQKSLFDTPHVEEKSQEDVLSPIDLSTGLNEN